MLEGGGSPAREQRERNDELAGRVEEVEGQVEKLGTEMNDGLAAVQGEVSELREAQERGTQRLRRARRMREGTGSPATTRRVRTGAGQRGPAFTAPAAAGVPRAGYVDPAEDDEDVFGEAWELVQEWRELKETHPGRGKGLDWLRAEERLLSVELALLEDHGLTLPPETYPLKGLDRSAQVNWRRKALDDTQKARKRRELLRRVGRVITLGRWRR